VTCSVDPKPGGKIDIRLTVSNTGVAPIYYRWPVEVSVKTGDRIVYKALQDGIDIRKWIPGKNAAVAAFRMPKDMVPGDYTIAIAIINPDTGEPGIEFANDRSYRQKDGRYAIGTFATGH
jgi:hypothetical protein